MTEPSPARPEDSPPGPAPTPRPARQPRSPRSSRSAAPVPPRSPARAHALGVVIAVVGGIVSFGALALATAGAVTVTEPASIDLRWPLLAAVLLGVTTWAGMRSSAGAAVAGGAWTVAGLIGLLLPDLALSLAGLVPEQSLGLPAREGASLLLTGGGALAVGATLVGAAGATSVARRRGRGQEQVEHSRQTTGEVTVPPRSRLPAHIVSSVVGFASSLLALAVVGGVTGWGLVLMTTGERLNDELPWIVTVLVLLLATLLPSLIGAWSSLGPAFGAAVWLATSVQYVTGLDVAWWEWSGRLADLVGPSSPEVSPWAPHATGLSLALGVALAGAALGSHLARRDGRSFQRREHRITREQNGS